MMMTGMSSLFDDLPQSSGTIDSRKYDDIFLLAKILMNVNLEFEERRRLFKHFEKQTETEESEYSE